MMLLLKQESGVSAQVSHKLVGNHYDVPMVSFADLIDDRVVEDGHVLHDIYVDGLHPNDLGMQYIADFLIEELDTIYNKLPDIGELPVIPETLPDPLMTDVYAHTYMYTISDIVPLSNNGWTPGTTKWSTETEGSEISFQVDGNSVSFIYTRHNIGTRGQVEAWVDEGPHQTYDAYWTETWGPAPRLALVEENLSDGEHTLHVKVTGENTSGGDGHYFEILNICKAGNFEGAAPIAIAGEKLKILIGTEVTLDGTESFDPDGDSIVSYTWSVVSSPGGSTAEIVSPSDSITQFSPDQEGFYKIGLIVNDGFYNSVTGIKRITAKLTNSVPVANAGNDTTINLLDYSFLNGTGSNDADGDLLLYKWELTSQPEGFNPVLNYLNTPHPQIRVYVEGEYVLSLVVDDSIAVSDPDYVTVTGVEVLTLTSFQNSTNCLITYPNPSKSTFFISYTIHSPASVTLTLYSLAGIKVADLVNEYQLQGDYTFELNLDEYDCKENIYFIKMMCDNEIIINKLLKANH
jgi:hypothetical protein